MYDNLKYPKIGVDKCGFIDDGDCDHVLSKDSNCIGCFNKLDTGCPLCKNSTTHYLMLGHCYEKGVDVPGYYWTNDNSYLYACSKGCKVCVDGVSDHCLECMEFHHLQLSLPGGTQGECILKCPKGYSSINKICRLCHSSCKECSAENDSSACTSCYPPKVLTPLPNRICDPNGCPDGHYIGPGSICIPCNLDYCLTCYGANPTNCLTCHPGKYLKTDTSECVSKCPSNYYYNSNKCYPCDPSCATCDNPTRTNCLTCKPGVLL